MTISQQFPKFNVYDQIGYILVGSIGLMVIYLDCVLLNIPFPKFELESAIIWLVVAYFLGHVVQAIANVVVREKRVFTKKEKELLSEAKKFFEVSGASDEETWNLCYMMVLGKDMTGQISLFNAYYGMYRGWLIIFIIESLFLIGYVVLSPNFFSMVLLVASIFLIILFYKRAKRFYNYLKIKVLQSFLLLRKN